MSEYQKLNLSINQGVAKIQLDCQENLNAFNAVMIDEVLRALEQCNNDPMVHVIVLCSAGKAFSGGGDIREMAVNARQGINVLERTAGPVAGISLKIKKLPKLVIASVHGAVAGAAFSIALACDLCIAAENAKFIQAFVNVALVPDAGGLYLLSRAIGANKAMNLALTGRPVDAQEALQLGLVCLVYPTDELEEKTETFAQKMALGPLQSYAKMKLLSYESQFSAFESFIELERNIQISCGRTEDYLEGVTAFLEKRPAHFTGK